MSAQYYDYSPMSFSWCLIGPQWKPHITQQAHSYRFKKHLTLAEFFLFFIYKLIFNYFLECMQFLVSYTPSYYMEDFRKGGPKMYHTHQVYTKKWILMLIGYVWVLFHWVGNLRLGCFSHPTQILITIVCNKLGAVCFCLVKFGFAALQLRFASY